MRNLLSDGEQKDQAPAKVTVRIAGRAQTLNDLCDHWLLGPNMAERQEESAVFRLTEPWIHHLLPSLLLSYGCSLRVLERPGCGSELQSSPRCWRRIIGHIRSINSVSPGLRTFRQYSVFFARAAGLSKDEAEYQHLTCHDDLRR